MNKQILALIALAFPLMGQADSPKKDELTLEISNVTALIQSSRSDYSDKYLMIGKVKSALVAREKGPQTPWEDLVPAGSRIEIALPLSSCWKEASLAFNSEVGTSLKIENIRMTYFKETLNDPNHDYFIKAEPVVSATQNTAECFVSK